MEAKARAYTFLGDEGAVKIPFFQRAYVWDKNNWEDLLEELSEITKTHFLGSLILKQQKSRSGEPKEVLVIDGQQRLTTLTVLLKAIYDQFDDELKENCKNEIIKYMFYKKNATDKNYQIKIIHSRIDAKYFTKIIGNVQDKIVSKISDIEYSEINEKSNKILQCYKYFYTELLDKPDDTKIALFNNILNTENKIIVLIDLLDNDNEQAIFDTINSAGVRLSGTDIVKNALFQRALELMENSEVLDLYNTYWEDIFNKDNESVVFWNTQKSTGRLMRDNSEILLQSIAIIKGIYDPDKHILSSLPDLYKVIFNNLDKESIIGLIKEIYEYANIYKNNISDFEISSLFSFDNYLERVLHILYVCELSTFHPYILFLLKKYNNDETLLKRNLKTLECFVIKRMILRQETKSYNKLCKEFINDECSVEKRLQQINDNQVKNALDYTDNKSATLLLFWIELYRRYIDTKQSVKEIKYNYSLEHIMPQAWEQYWSDVQVYDNQNIVITDQEMAKNERDKKIYSIGNMTLLNSRLNTSLRNYKFEIKIEGEGRKKGIRKYSDLLITKEILLEYDNENNYWDERTINKRKIKLENEIIEIWNNT
jgi:uncharacterized protein with ParB-like and HNH nuclease domain